MPSRMHVALLAAALVLAGCGSGGAASPKPPSVPRLDGLRLPARVQGTRIEAIQDGRFQPRFWAGVNLGSTIPGHLPGELAATARRLRPLAPRDGAARRPRRPRLHDPAPRVLRRPARLRPGASRAAHPRDPGRLDPRGAVPGDPERLRPVGRRTGSGAELRDAVAVVHGDATLPPRPGHADGRYRSDVAPWLLAWSIGIEWDPQATRASDLTNAGVAPFRGRYFRASRDADADGELARSMLDYTAGWRRRAAGAGR